MSIFLGSAIQVQGVGASKYLQHTISALIASGRSAGLHVSIIEYDMTRDNNAYNELDMPCCKFKPGSIVIVHNALRKTLPWAVRKLILCGRHVPATIVLVNSVIQDTNLRANMDVIVCEQTGTHHGRVAT